MYKYHGKTVTILTFRPLGSYLGLKPLFEGLLFVPDTNLYGFLYAVWSRNECLIIFHNFFRLLILQSILLKCRFTSAASVEISSKRVRLYTPLQIGAHRLLFHQFFNLSKFLFTFPKITRYIYIPLDLYRMNWGASTIYAAIVEIPVRAFLTYISSLFDQGKHARKFVTLSRAK